MASLCMHACMNVQYVYVDGDGHVCLGGLTYVTCKWYKHRMQRMLLRAVAAL